MASKSGIALRDLAERVRPVELRSEQPSLPVVQGLSSVLPEGLTRGITVAVGAAPGVGGATTLAWAVAAGPSQAGAWVAMVGGGSAAGGGVGGRAGVDGRPGAGGAGGDSPGHGRGAGSGMWGLVAAAGVGVALERLVVVAAEERPVSGWGPVVAALVEGFEVVVVGPGVQLRAGDDRRLAARLREREAVLVRVGEALAPSPAHVRLLVTEGEWQGVEGGAGYLRARRVVVEATGRGAASRPRRAELLLPGPGGEVVAAPVATAAPGDRARAEDLHRLVAGE